MHHVWMSELIVMAKRIINKQIFQSLKPDLSFFITMLPMSARLQTGFVYNHLSCPEYSGNHKLEIFRHIVGDIKQDEKARYPSVSTSLCKVYGNDGESFSVKCFTKRSPDYGKGGKYETLKECDFRVTGRYLSAGGGRVAAQINKCQLHHRCQEELYIEARDKLGLSRGERQRNTKRSFIELHVDGESKKNIVQEVSLLSIGLYCVSC